MGEAPQPDREPRNFDYLVVGAGSTGSVLARRLVDAGYRVLLVESGPSAPPTEAAARAVRNAAQPAVAPGINWSYKAHVHGDGERRTGMGSSYTFESGRLVGGSSAINATLACRGAPQDYDAWSNQVGGAWSWQHVLPAFRRLENDTAGDPELHGLSGPMPIRREAEAELTLIQRAFEAACRAAGAPQCVDHNDPRTSGVGPFPKNAVDGRRVSTKEAYLGPIAENPLLTLLCETTVERLEWASPRRCKGVRVSRGGDVSVLQADRIVVCAGAIGTPTLLLRSGVGAPQELSALGLDVHLPLAGVGRGLMDHPVIGIWGVPKAGHCALGESARQVLWRWTSSDATYANDMHLCMVAGIDVRALFPDMAKRVASPTLAGILAVNNRSYSAGRVTLNPAAPQGPPQVYLNCLGDPRDLPPLMEGVRAAWSLLQSHGLQQHFDSILAWTEGMIESDNALRQAVRAFVRPAAHLGCSARMGPTSDPSTVVDPNGLVHGAENLWLADMSIAPSLPSAPTHLTALMIAERIAEHLIGEAA